LAHLMRELADVGSKALPLGRNVPAGLAGIARAEAGDEHLPGALEADRFDRGQKGLVHFQRLHKLQVVETAFVAQLLRCDAELLAEGASEGLVTAILGGERDVEDVARSAS